ITHSAHSATTIKSSYGTVQITDCATKNIPPRTCLDTQACAQVTPQKAPGLGRPTQCLPSLGQERRLPKGKRRVVGNEIVAQACLFLCGFRGRHYSSFPKQ